MKYIEEFSFGDLAKKIIKQIIVETVPHENYTFLDFCSSHAHPIHRYGLSSCLPDNLIIQEMSRNASLLIEEQTIEQGLLASKKTYILCCGYPELLAKTTYQMNDLMVAKSHGADIRIVYQIDDAIHLAKFYPDKQIMFIAIGFEGDMIETAKAMQTIQSQSIPNISVFLQHKTALVAMLQWLDTERDKAIAANGILLPIDCLNHGLEQYHALQARYQKPILISGFEPIDILQSILYLIRQHNEHKTELVYQVHHSVAQQANLAKCQLIKQVFHSQHAPIREAAIFF